MEKNNKVVIGIVGVVTNDDEGFEVSALYDGYKEMTFEKNCIPFMIPPINPNKFNEETKEPMKPVSEKEMEVYKEMVDLCDGILIPGGCDMYNYHKFIIKYAIEKNIPVLGICLGMQLLACVDNDEYCLNKLDNESHKKTGEEYAHNVKIMEGSLLSKILEEKEITVNSRHMYHITGVKDFIISAYAPDGLIEAIELPGKDFVVGVQWHPEKMIGYDKNANKLLDAYIDACYKNKVKNENINIGRSI